MIKISHLMFAPLLLIIFLVTACGGSDSQSDLEHYNKAVSHVENNNHSSAIVELKNAIQINSSNYDARWLLGEIYLKMAAGQAALDEFEAALSANYQPASMLPYFEALLRTGKFDQIITETEKLVKDSPTAELFSIRAHAYMGKNDKEKADQLLKKAIEINKESASALLGLARLSLSFNDLTGANKKIDKTLSIDPGNIEALILKGSIEVANDDYPSAIATYRKGLESAEFNPGLLFGLIRALVENQDFDEASKAIKEASRYYSDNLLIVYYKGYIAYRKNNLSGAKELFLNVIKSNRRHPNSLLMLGIISYKEGQMEQAKEYLSEYTKYVSNDFPAIKMLAAVKISLNEYDSAQQDLLPVVKDNPDDAHALTLLGNTYMHSGQVEKGLKYLQKASQLSPDSTQIKTQIALSHLAQGDYESGIKSIVAGTDLEPDQLSLKIFRIMATRTSKKLDAVVQSLDRLIAEYPDKPQPQNLAGIIHLQNRDLEAAQHHFNKALQIDSQFISAQLNLAVTEELRGKYKESMQHYRKVLTIDSDNMKANLAIARLHFKMGEDESAIRVLNEAANSHQDSVEPLVALGEYYLASQNPRLALKYADQGIERIPNDIDIKIVQSRALAETGEREAAIEQLKDLSKKHPADTEVLKRIANIQMLMNDIDGTRNSLNLALRGNKFDTNILSFLTQLEMKAGNYSEAEQHLSVLLKANPGHVLPHTLRARLYAKSGKYREALEAYSTAEKIEPDNQQLIVEIYQTLIRLDRKQEAFNKLTQWLKNHPEDINTKALLASQYEYFGELDKAQNLYEEIVNSEKEHVMALNNLAWIYFQSGTNRQAALELSERAYKLADNDAQVIDTYGWILANEGDLKKATDLLKQAHTLSANDRNIQYHLAFVLEKSGQLEDAKSLLIQALADDSSFTNKSAAQALLKKLQ